MGTVSKAFENSRMATSIWDLELKEDNKSCVVVISCVSQLLPDRKPCWRFVRILWSSTWSRMCLQTMCSKSLQVIQVRETGLLSLGAHVNGFFTLKNIEPISGNRQIVLFQFDCSKKLQIIFFCSQ